MKFQKGQIVYVQGLYRAKVIECREFTVTCDVYEGLAPGPVPQEASYDIALIEQKRRK